MVNKAKMGRESAGASSPKNKGSGRHGNGVQAFDGRSNLGSGDGGDQPKNPGPGAGQVKQDA